jgi:hypothetical protein
VNLELHRFAALYVLPAFVQLCAQQAGRIAAAGVKQGVHVAAGHLVDPSQAPGLDDAVYPQRLAALVQQAYQERQTVGGALPVELGTRNGLLDLLGQGFDTRWYHRRRS